MSLDLKEWLRAVVGERFAEHRYVLAVSGGLDSVCLTYLVARSLTRSQLVVAHFNHGIRSNSHADARFVRELAFQLCLPFKETFRQGTKISEAALREERYAFLHEVRRTTGSEFIFLGHQAQDQLETQVMRLVRGTGIDGLKGMSEKEGTLLRPLLSLTRSYLRSLAQGEGWKYREDESNQDRRYLRNQIRLDVIPQLEKLSEQFGGKAAFYSRMTQLSRELDSASQWLKKREEELLRAAVFTRYWNRYSFPRYLELSAEERALLLRAIRRRMALLPLNRSEVRRTEELILKGTREFCVGGGMRVLQSCGQIYFQSELHRREGLPVFEEEQGAVKSSSLGFQSSALDKGWAWRTFRAGDRWKNKKLKVALLENRVPRPERLLLPLLTLKDSCEILWFPQKGEKAPGPVLLDFPFSHLTAGAHDAPG